LLNQSEKHTLSLGNQVEVKPAWLKWVGINRPQAIHEEMK